MVTESRRPHEYRLAALSSRRLPQVRTSATMSFGVDRRQGNGLSLVADFMLRVEGVLMRQTAPIVIAAVFIGIVTLVSCQAQAAPTTPPSFFPVTITIDAAKPIGDLNPIWRWCGYDEPNYTYAPNGKKLIAQFSRREKLSLWPRFLPHPQSPCHRRRHSAPEMGIDQRLYGRRSGSAESMTGRSSTRSSTRTSTPADKPYAQIGFMPKALSLKPEPYEHHWKPGDPYSQHLHRLDDSPEGLQQVA